jgi:hypothetical protein
MNRKSIGVNFQSLWIAARVIIIAGNVLIKATSQPAASTGKIGTKKRDTQSQKI